MPDLTPYRNAASGGETYVGVAVSFDPMGSSTPIVAPVAAPTATGSGTGGTLAAGTYRYKVTFVGGSPAGETTPSPATTGYVASGSTSSVALTVIPTGGTGTTGRNIYQSVNAGTYFLIKSIADNTTVAYTDTGADVPQGIVAPTLNTTNSGGAGGAPVPTEYIPVTDDNLNADFDQAEDKTMRGSDLTDAIMVPTRLDEKGDFTWMANSALGPITFQLHLGGYSTINTSTATSTGPTATVNGVSVIPVTLSGLTQGMQVDIGSSSTKERTTVSSYTPGTLTTYELSNTENAHASGALTVTIPQQTKYARSLLSAGLRKRIPLACIENGAGDGDWAWVHPNMMADQLDFTFSDKAAAVKTAWVGSGDPLYYSRDGLLPDGSTPADGTTHPYAPNADDEAIALHPLTSRNCYLTAFGDPAATGSSTLRAAIGATNVTISSKQGLKRYAPMNGGQHYSYFRVGGAGLDVSYDEIQTSLRPDVWYDAVRISKAVSLIMGVWENYGTAASPSFKGVSLVIPSMKYKTTPRQAKIGEVDMQKKSGKALSPPGIDDYLIVWVAN